MTNETPLIIITKSLSKRVNKARMGFVERSSDYDKNFNEPIH